MDACVRESLVPAAALPRPVGDRKLPAAALTPEHRDPLEPAGPGLLRPLALPHCHLPRQGCRALQLQHCARPDAPAPAAPRVPPPPAAPLAPGSSRIRSTAAAPPRHHSEAAPGPPSALQQTPPPPPPSGEDHRVGVGRALRRRLEDGGGVTALQKRSTVLNHLLRRCK